MQGCLSLCDILVDADTKGLNKQSVYHHMFSQECLGKFVISTKTK